MAAFFEIRLFPLALLTPFRIPANEFTNQIRNADIILGNNGNERTEKIEEAKTSLEKVNKTIDFFSNRLQSLFAQ